MVVLAVSLLNAKIYRDNELNVVIDEENKLMWQDINEVPPYIAQEDAKMYCASLEYAGYSNWHVPSIEEFDNFQQIYNVQNNNKYINGNMFYWTSENLISFSILSMHKFHETDNLLRNYTFCVRKISPDENIDKISNSCSFIKDKIPKKPDATKFQKRPYETEKEFKQSQHNSLNRWKLEINKYEKICDFTAKIIDYNLMDELFKYSYNISLRGIGKNSVEKIVPCEKAKYFVNTLNKKIVLKSVIGMNEDENFYIKRVIYPVGKNKNKKLKEKTEQTLPSYLVSGVLAKKVKVKYADDGTIGYIKKGEKVSYDPVTKEIYLPANYKGDSFVKEPSIQRSIKMVQKSVWDDQHKTNKVNFEIVSNFPIDNISIDVDSKVEILNMRQTKTANSYYEYVTTKYAIDAPIKKYQIKLKATKFERLYECTKKGCQEKLLEIDL